MIRPRIVIDTNVLVSGILYPESVPGRVYLHCLDFTELVFSATLIEEVQQVLSRPKFDRYIDQSTRASYLAQLMEAAIIVPTITVITLCRDPKDNHVLEAAVNGSADIIVTGDKDLVDLNPFHGIRILTPAQFLEQ